MPDEEKPRYPNPREEDIMAGDRRISRPDSSLPDWEVPDTAYRPIPIVWFTGALVVQMVAVFAIFILLLGQHGAITIALSALVTGAIGAWTWDRGMKDAGTGWKVATLAILTLTFLLVCAGSLDRL
ncbi:hypothetical protein [Erythrobacter rubeus]|uniref:Uncharacterized protein n=1 Tax=Erythrobacter rubeus TaxID=2760803 RepID=A0ABR8KRX1_9SPHN|nr:hypothetical protein [Erythrobacter rubeus]MBD2841818.1 hypothetical protein [Erythrobacter rubeus]